MKHFISYLLILGFVFLAACGGGEKADSLEAKKERLKQKKQQATKLKAEIAALEKEIAELDPRFAAENANLTLVTVIPVSENDFSKSIEVQGVVETENDAVISPETSGVVTFVGVSEGQAVGAGQVVVRQSSNIIEKQISQVETSLELAKTVYKRQENLWKQKVGTEIQYLEAKNNVEALEKQLQVLKAQAGLGQVTAPFSGVVEELYIKKGQVAMPGTPLMRIVATNQLKVVAEVSENYLKKVRRGNIVRIEFPSLDKKIDMPVTRIGQTINPANRTFRIEMNVPNVDGELKPELLATVKIKEEEQNNAIIVPTNLIQKDKNGYYVYVLEKKKDKTFAKKVRIERGDTNANETVIEKGLNGTEKVIKEGFRSVSDGMEVRLVEDDKKKK